MKKMTRVLLLVSAIIPVILLIGCAEDEVVRVGTPFNNEGTTGADFHSSFKDPETISELRTLIEKEEKIGRPNDLIAAPDLVFTLDRPEENVSEIWRYVWYQEDGSSVLSNRESAVSVEEDQEFYVMNEEQTTELKSILE
ncbi:MAG: hypothetical protein ACQEV0_09260 [Bacillota bacterium]